MAKRQVIEEALLEMEEGRDEEMREYDFLYAEIEEYFPWEDLDNEPFLSVEEVDEGPWGSDFDFIDSENDPFI